ncbi:MULTISPECIES: cytochrome b [unclassified Brevundimonas]|uniref:cytochrome b n=1 Tax=unclassified Brevundimonas TaxID=2622653 RepID=UPI0025BD6F71|nr:MULTISPECIES: cytochrome b [unclassified Brevundimonas]
MFDNGLKYGLVTRVLHWVMAALLVYQLGGVVAGAALGETPLTETWGSSHKPVGFTLFVLAVIRALWGLVNLTRRPKPHEGLIGRLAVIGHLALYVLVLAVPAIALIRQYGSGRPFEPFGIPLMAGGHERIEWMTKLGGDWHGELGWVLLVAIVGHLIMALVHHFVWKDGTLKRMAG